MKLKLDHIAIAVSDLQLAIDAYEKNLGLACEKVEDVKDERSRVAFFDVGGAHLELVSPMDAEAPLAKSIDKRGEGLHHICLEVEDIALALAALKARGVRLVNETPNTGAGGSKVAFVHPKSMNGVLIELVEKP